MIFEEGAKALGMGGAFTARADDPSAIFFNPAGICRLDGTQLYFGATGIITATDFTGSDPFPGEGVPEKTKTQFFFPATFYVTHKLNENVSAGFGFFNPFGLGREWKNPESYSGRLISYKVDLKTFYFNPTIAWRMNEQLSFGAGAQLVYSTVLLDRYQATTNPLFGPGLVNIAKIELDGNNSIDAGYNAGILYEHEKISVGLSYRSNVTVDYDGDATFTQVPTGNPTIDAQIAQLIPDEQGVATKVEFPPLVSLGLAFTQLEKWTFEVDVNWVGWSTFDVLPLDFAKDDSLDTERPQNYKDAMSVRSGAEYRPNDVYALRLGYYYDPSPQPDGSVSPLLPDSDRHGITIGFGYTSGPWTVDLFDLVLIFLERDTHGKNYDGYNGTYSSWANLLGANVGYRF